MFGSNSEQTEDETRHVSSVKCAPVISGAKCAKSAVQGVIALACDARRRHQIGISNLCDIGRSAAGYIDMTR